MTSRNPDDIEDLPSPDCSDVGGGGSGRLGRSSPGRGVSRAARLVDVPGAERQALPPEAAWHTLSAEEVLRAEGADPRHGLSSAEAASRAGWFGPNTLAAGRAEPRWRAFIRQYSDPMQIVLLVVGLLSLFRSGSWEPAF